MNRGETPALLPRQTELLERVEGLSRRTGGAFDPHLRALSEVWGFSEETHRVPTPGEIAAAMEQRLWDLGAAL